MKVKICGITRADDVKVCQDNDAGLIGFINIERSLRFVNLDEIIKLTSDMQDKNKAVLVMEPEKVNEVENAVNQTGINRIQLHSLSNFDIESLKQNNPQIKIIKAIGIPKNIDEPKIIEIKEFAEVCDYLLFDSEIEGKSGGTGKHIPLDKATEAAEIAKKHNENIKLFLAGGINYNRIKSQGNNLKTIFDYVDVNSGVEEHPGIKNDYKIKEFMQVIK